MDSKEPAALSAHPDSHPASWDASTQFAPTQFEPVGRGRHVPAPAGLNLCQVGVVLRVVLGVQAVVLLGGSFAASGPLDALNRWMQASAVALPASLLWLVLSCWASKALPARRAHWQTSLACALGALCAALAQSQPVWMDWMVLGAAPRGWAFVPAMLTGALLAWLTLTWLRHRAHSALPAEAAARLAELQARIQPHFLFNALNTAIALVQIEPLKAERVLEDLAELFRQALASPHARSSLGEEIDLAQRYLSIEQLRFGERIQVRWDLAPEAAAAELPALVLQPLLENAVRHGIEVSPQGGWIRVRTRVQGGRVVITVRNSVPRDAARGANAGHGIALRNVRQRLQLMHDLEAEFQTSLKPGAEPDAPQVFTVRLAVPLVTSAASLT